MMFVGCRFLAHVRHFVSQESTKQAHVRTMCLFQFLHLLATFPKHWKVGAAELHVSYFRDSTNE